MTSLFAPFQPLLTDSGLRRFSFKFQQRQASAGLEGLVHSYIQIDTPGPSDYPVIPDGTQALFVSPDGTMLSGGVTQALDLKLPVAGEYFGIRFYPGVLRHFFRVDINDIGHQLVDSQFLSSPFISHLHEHVYQHETFLPRAELCDAWLLKQLDRRPGGVFDEALGWIYSACGNINVTRELASKTGVSSRHLNRLFQQYTGLSTKSFAQAIRFQNACKLLSKQPEKSLKIALNLGYFDQSHLLKDFHNRLEQSPIPFFNRFMSDFYNRSPL